VRRGDLVTAVALGESDAQAWRAGKESRGRGGGGRQGSSLFIVAEGGGGGQRPVVLAKELPVLIV
jgi:hypothetical protein